MSLQTDVLPEGIPDLMQWIRRRQMVPYYCENADQANVLIKQLVPEGSTVGWGDSLTLDETGVKNYFRSGLFTVFDRDAAGNETELKESILRKALTCDWYLVGANAITKKGEILNIDGRGNRTAAISFGPKNVIITVGMNKICDDIPSAIDRIHKIACVQNVKRHGLKTPCAYTGECNDCTVPECACAQILITRFTRTPDRIRVILIGEALGF